MLHITTSDCRYCHNIDMIYPNLLKYYKFNEQKDLIITAFKYAVNSYVLDNLIRQMQLKVPVAKIIIKCPIEGEPHAENIYIDGIKVIYVADGTNNLSSWEILFKLGTPIVKEDLNNITKYYLINHNIKEELFFYRSYG